MRYTLALVGAIFRGAVAHMAKLSFTTRPSCISSGSII